MRKQKQFGWALGWGVFLVAAVGIGCAGGGAGTLGDNGTTTGTTSGGTSGDTAGGRGCTADEFQPNYVREMRNTTSSIRLRNWDSFPITIWVDRTAPWSSEREAAALQGFSRWESALPNQVRFQFVSNPDQADIRLEFVLQSELGGRTVGLTSSTFEVVTGRMIDAQIQLAIDSPDSNDSYTAADLRATAVHEMGHALGIAGHSPEIADVMYFANRLEELTLADVNTLRTAYCDVFSARSRADGKRVALSPTRTEAIRCEHSHRR